MFKYIFNSNFIFYYLCLCGGIFYAFITFNRTNWPMLGFTIILFYMDTVADRNGRVSMEDLSEPTCRAWLSAGKLVLIFIRTNLPGVRHIRQVGSDKLPIEIRHHSIHIKQYCGKFNLAKLFLLRYSLQR